MRIIGMLIISLLCAGTSLAQIFEVSDGIVRFHSDAPQELIRAQSTALRGAIDIKKKAFAFRINVSTFNGFNSPLQKEHFNENYLESTKFMEAVFSGKIIEDVNFGQTGDYEVRAKGKLQIHGLEQERIITAHISSRDGQLSISSDFTVTLADYDIKIPRVVYDKLAPEIKVSVNARLQPLQ